MSLQDSYEAQPDYNACKTCIWTETLDTQEQQWLRDKIHNPLTDIRRLWKACTDNGLDVKETSFRLHVKRDVRNKVFPVGDHA